MPYCIIKYSSKDLAQKGKKTTHIAYSQHIIAYIGKLDTRKAVIAIPLFSLKYVRYHTKMGLYIYKHIALLFGRALVTVHRQ